MQSENRLKYMPISFFAMVMGMTGLTIAWEKASEIFDYSDLVYRSLLVQSIILFVLLSAFYLYKGVAFRKSVVEEWSNPVKRNFVPAISISLLLLAIALLPLSQEASRVLWIAGASTHLVIMLVSVNSWLHHETYEIHHMNPAWFIPAVGNVVVPLAGVPLGYEAISWFFFSVGLVFWLILMVIVFNRVIFHQPLPVKLLPTLFILIAPPAVGFLAYIKLTGGLDSFAIVLYNFALFLTLVLISQVPRFARLPFFLSWWAYSFPLAAVSIASMVMAQLSGQPFYGYVGLTILFTLSALILLLLVRTVMAITKGAICTPEH